MTDDQLTALAQATKAMFESRDLIMRSEMASMRGTVEGLEAQVRDLTEQVKVLPAEARTTVERAMRTLSETLAAEASWRSRACCRVPPHPPGRGTRHARHARHGAIVSDFEEFAVAMLASEIRVARRQVVRDVDRRTGRQRQPAARYRGRPAANSRRGLRAVGSDHLFRRMRTHCAGAYPPRAVSSAAELSQPPEAPGLAVCLQWVRGLI